MHVTRVTDGAQDGARGNRADTGGGDDRDLVTDYGRKNSTDASDRWGHQLQEASVAAVT
jgi:hypothetical protein